MQEDISSWEASDGLALKLYHWSPEGSPRGVVQLVHGLAEHAARYKPVAEALVAEGYTVYAADHRGHGGSVRSAEDLGFFADEDGWNQAVRDLAGLARQLKAQHPGLPLAMVAHSMGSFMAQQLVIEHQGLVDALALSGSNGKAGPILAAGRLAARLERKRMGRRGRSKALNFLSFGAYNKAFKPARTDFDWLSRDPAQVDLYIADPLCGFLATTQFWVDFLAGLQLIEEPAQQARIEKTLPVLIFGGSRDPVGQEGKGLRKLRAALQVAGLENTELKLYPEGRHEMFNETNRGEVLGDLKAWLARSLPTPS